MKKTGIFYGSTTGTTADVAQRLGRLIGISDEDIHNVAEVAPSKFGEYETLLLGTSTWGSGELQEDWYDFVDGARALDLKGHRIALFGCGDETMSDTFCGALGELYRSLQNTGAEFFGAYPADCYTFESSGSMDDGKMVGLALDEVNHPDLTDSRLAAWVKENKLANS